MFKKLFIFLRLRQLFERLWGQSGGTFGPWKAQTEAAAIAPNQKVVDKFFFFKVCAEGEVARQGVRPQCPLSPLLSPLLIFSSFFSLNLSQVFFPSLYLFSFLFSSLLLFIISFLFSSFILPSSFLLSLSPPLFLSVSLFLTSFFPFSILLHSLIPYFSVPLSFSLFSSFFIFRSFSIFFPFFFFTFFFFSFFFFAWVRPP